MKAHIISTGDELLLGDIVDTNSNYLCHCLRELGLVVDKIVSVGDDKNHISRAISSASSKADICLVTGGLGPTKDDVTAYSAARAAGVPLEMNQAALKKIKAFFEQKEFEWTRENEKQALLPKGSTTIDNHKGTAPGFYLKINQCLFVFLPGPPAEMHHMFEQSVQPILTRRFHLTDNLLVERLTVFMLGESKLGKILDPFENVFPDFRLGIRVSFPTIEVKIRFGRQPDDRQKAAESIQKAKQWVFDQLGEKVVSKTGLSLAGEVALLLTGQKKTLAVAESCTGGLISHLITDVPGASDYFLFSGITYSNAAKKDILGVKEQTLVVFGAVHEQTACEMAAGALKKAGADVAVSTTGIAGPTGGTGQKPVGMVCIGLATKDGASAKTFVFRFKDREKNKRMFAMSALEVLRKHLVSETKTP